MLTKQQCQKKLFHLGIKLGVSPKLISERLLSIDDKHDMLNGLLADDALECHVKVWMTQGMRDYANGSGLIYRRDIGLPIQSDRVMDKNAAKRKFRR